MQKKVVVAMSGGVDSSTVAALLQKQGFEVVGATLQLFVDNKNESTDARGCRTTKDAVDAAKVAKMLGVEHVVLNREKIFHDTVIKSFVKDYLKGITPLPCALCDRKVKMRELIDFAKSIGAVAVATGHYANIVQNKGEINELHRASNPNRDQTHFLYGLSQDDINFMMCPLGKNSKLDTRKIATEFGLHVDQKKDSQDICFVRNNDYVSVIQSVSPTEIPTGKIIHIETKKEMGRHRGLLYYTIGQRKGIGVPYFAPLYAVAMDHQENILYVGEEKHLYSSCFTIEEINLFSHAPQKGEELEMEVCVRALQPCIPAKIKILTGGRGFVSLSKPARAVTAGQVCSFYEGTRLLGGGIISCVEISG